MQVEGFDRSEPVLFLLVWDVDVDLLPVCSRGSNAVELSDDFNQSLAAE